MAEVLVGETVKEARELFQGFHELVAGDGDAENLPNKLKVFSGVRQFPMRVKCATLAWHTIIAALDGTDGVCTE
jgi:nitrogen fixation NifU-like protein